jgi:hypothetical protein
MLWARLGPAMATLWLSPVAARVRTPAYDCCLLLIAIAVNVLQVQKCVWSLKKMLSVGNIGTAYPFDSHKTTSEQNTMRVQII